MKESNVILEKSMAFAIRIVNLYKYLNEEKHENVMSKQLLRSGTSIGANANEATQGQSRNDFLAKMSISLKEVFETKYWLELLYRTEYLTADQYRSMEADCVEVMKILTNIIKSTKAVNENDSRKK